MTSSEYYDTYPRLYPLASTMGIAKDEIDKLFIKIHESDYMMNKYVLDSRIETYLRIILTRLYTKDESFVDLHKYKFKDPYSIEDTFGKYAFEFAWDLLEII